jgi:F420-dependent oxidoreductase-like protein
VTSMLSSFRVMVEPQDGGTYEAMLALALRAEALAFGGFFRADHYHPINAQPESDATDCWAVLAGLARDTKAIRLGSLVSPVTFRHPSELAKVVATVDRMSGGRIEVGMGAGWFEKEHAAFGIPFPSPGARLDLLEESLEVCTRLWADGPATFDGKLFRLKDAPGYPKPAQRPRPPIILGGGGPKRTPALAARFADEFNVSARPHLETFAGDGGVFSARRQRVLDACRQVGRDPAMVCFSFASPTVVGTDERDVRRRSQRRLDCTNQRDEVDGWIARMRSYGMLVGTVDQVAERIKALRQAGCSRWYFQLAPVEDDGMLEIIAGELAPKCA